VRYVVADTETSPGGALTAAKKLVQEDHMFAVVANSVLTFAAANFLTSQGIPVLGSAQDGPEWVTSRNMFSVFGRADTTKVATTVRAPARLLASGWLEASRVSGGVGQWRAGRGWALMSAGMTPG
jgi:hypothetical protein